MITHSVWVTTSRFEATTPGENFINRRCFGEDFAAWLRTKLTESGHDVSDPIQEDFGWILLTTIRHRKFTISIGIMDESIGRMPAVWNVLIAYEKPLNSLRSWFKRAPIDTLNALFKEVRDTMESQSDFKLSGEEP